MTLMEGTVDPMDQPPLTADDRCDRCGAQAYMRVTLTSGLELLFCGHHGKEFGPKLAEAGATLDDQLEQLVESEQATAK